MPLRAKVAASILSLIALVSWVGIIYGDPGRPEAVADLETGDAFLDMMDKNFDDDDKAAKLKASQVKANHQQLSWQQTPESATWPSERNPLKDWDEDFEGVQAGFPTTTGSADWPFTKNPLLGFDADFGAEHKANPWKGWQGPEHNVYENLPAEYPFLETKLLGSSPNYPDWQNSGGLKENNVFDSYTTEGTATGWPSY
uniref:Uncharacterized protein n=1 Tax=Hanusia phi TaxID=3032 RepID=A0A7S0F1D8_9CRYP